MFIAELCIIFFFKKLETHRENDAEEHSLAWENVLRHQVETTKHSENSM